MSDCEVARGVSSVDILPEGLFYISILFSHCFHHSFETIVRCFKKVFAKLRCFYKFPLFIALYWLYTAFL